MRRFDLICGLSGALAVTLLPAAVSAQDLDQERSFCFAGKPLPLCDWFLITEFGMSVRLGGGGPGPVESGFPEQLNWELGVMLNVARQSAVGAVLFFRDLDADVSRAGIRGRYRHWLSRRWSLEAGAGVLLEANDVGGGSGGVLGFAGQLRANYKDLLGLSVEMETIDMPGLGTRHDWFVAGRIGSGVGVIGLGVVAVIGLLGLIAVSG